MTDAQKLREALDRMPDIEVSEHPTGTLLLRKGSVTLIVLEADQGWRVRWPDGGHQDFLDLTQMVHKILKWSWEK